MGAPSKLSVIRKAAALARVRLTLLLEIAPAFLFYLQENKKGLKAEGCCLFFCFL
jgi:hypothetical protein